MDPSILHGRIQLLGPYSTSRLPVILPGRNSTLCGRQHPRTPYRQFPSKLQGIHLVSTKYFKGSSITLHCNTTRSVCSKLLLLALRIILQKFNFIQVSSNPMRKNFILSYIQAVLVVIPHKVH